jgi:hypothetical protein
MWPESVLYRDGAGRTALHVCVAEHWSLDEAATQEVLRLLVQEGPQALRTRDSSGMIPLHLLLTRRWGKLDLSVVRHLVEAWPESVLVPAANDGARSCALLLAAGNPKLTLDVLYYLVRHCPGHYFARQR